MPVIALVRRPLPGASQIADEQRNIDPAFTQTADSRVSEMTLDGLVTNVSLPTGSQPSSITPGLSNTVWFNEFGTNSVGSMLIPNSTAQPKVTQYLIPIEDSSPTSVAIGPDGNLWFTNVVSSAPGVYDLQMGRVRTG